MNNGQLTGKQQAFINAYLGEANFNATKSARIAGYAGNDNSLSQRGHELLRNSKIASVISKRLQESAMSADEVLMRLAEQGRSDYTKYIQSDGTIDLEPLIDDGLAHLIKSTTPMKDGTNKIEFFDGQAALAMIAKHHGLLSDRLEVKIQNELDQALTLLEENLDTRAFNRILEILSG